MRTNGIMEENVIKYDIRQNMIYFINQVSLMSGCIFVAFSSSLDKCGHIIAHSRLEWPTMLKWFKDTHTPFSTYIWVVMKSYHNIIDPNSISSHLCSYRGDTTMAFSVKHIGYSSVALMKALFKVFFKTNFISSDSEKGSLNLQLWNTFVSLIVPLYI